MKKINELRVFYKQQLVGTMVLYKNALAVFAYDAKWLTDGFAISPFSLPLEAKVFVPKAELFDGVFGVFADSLPDGWGRLLVDRMLLKNRVNPAAITPLERLAIVGGSGMGALEYKPEIELVARDTSLDLDVLASECARVLRSEQVEDLDKLFRMGASSGGARPKIMTEVDGEQWLVKFPSSEDDENIGQEEYDYSLCARERGITMMPTKLFSSNTCAGYFGTQRFDRTNGEKVHMLSVSAILETSHRIPNLDYDILMKLTLALTKDFSEVERLYRLMCFNVFAHNRDDHSKNFTYLYQVAEKRWHLAPAYDLTYSYSLGGEHATTVHGEGKAPGMTDVLAVAAGIGMSNTRAKKIANEVQECVATYLRKYLLKS